jgi:flagellar biogenesis protein FliO
MSTLLLFLRMLLALGIVLGLVFLASRMLARGRGMLGAASGRAAPALRRGGSPLGRQQRRTAGRAAGSWLAGLRLAAPPPAAPMEVIGRRSLSRTSSLVLVRAGGRFLLLGTTAQSVELLAELSAADLAPAASELERGAPQDTSLDAWLADTSFDGSAAARAGLPPSAGERAARDRHVPATRAASAGRFAPALDERTPWTALPEETSSTTAWDAFLTSLRERTVRR